MADTKAMLTVKQAVAQAPEAKPQRPRQVSKEDLQFVSENQRMEGFSGQITHATAEHRPDMKVIAKSAIRFNAQVPGEVKRSPKPRITRFGDRP